MANNSKPWQHWWFWALLIPLGGILIGLSSALELPLRDPWFWAIAVGGGLGFRVYLDKRNRELRGDVSQIDQLKAEVDDLKSQVNKLARQRLSDTLIDAQDLIKIKEESKGIVVIMFSDIEGFTTIVEQQGDTIAHERLKRHNQIARAAIRKHEGQEVKHLGDGFMINFSSARQALLCAAEIQNEINATSDEHLPLRVRFGVHAGEPIHDDQDFVGRTVILAQRIMNQANGGQIFVSEVVKNLVGAMKGFQYVSQGTRRLEGISEPQNLFEFHPIDALGVPLDTEINSRLQTLERQVKISPD